METKLFNMIVKQQITCCTNVLINKAIEYATEDRLHNFKVAATLQGVSPRKALAGMMAKHTVSVYDMCGTDVEFPIGLWNEKITDSINYLLLLRALIEENSQELHVL